jgi:hypothetical protein
MFVFGAKKAQTWLRTKSKQLAHQMMPHMLKNAIKSASFSRLAWQQAWKLGLQTSLNCVFKAPI